MFCRCVQLSFSTDECSNNTRSADIIKWLKLYWFVCVVINKTVLMETNNDNNNNNNNIYRRLYTDVSKRAGGQTY